MPHCNDAVLFNVLKSFLGARNEVFVELGP